MLSCARPQLAIRRRVDFHSSNNQYLGRPCHCLCCELWICKLRSLTCEIFFYHPTGVTPFATAVRLNTVATPATSIRTSFPASCNAAAHTSGKLALVGFSDPTRPIRRNFCDSAGLAFERLANPAALAEIAAAQA